MVERTLSLSSVAQRDEHLRQLVATETTKRQELESSIRDLESTIISLNATLAHERDRRAALLRNVTALAARHAALIEPEPPSVAPAPPIAALTAAGSPWLKFQAAFSRDDAQRYLSGRPVNSFVTRPSTRVANSLALSYVSDTLGTIKHTLLHSDGDGRFFADQRPDELFESLQALLESFGFSGDE